MTKKPENAPAEVARETLIVREGGTLIVNTPADAPETKETENAEDPLRPAREG